jgi:hypothetical protein
MNLMQADAGRNSLMQKLGAYRKGPDRVKVKIYRAGGETQERIATKHGNLIREEQALLAKETTQLLQSSQPVR